MQIDQRERAVIQAALHARECDLAHAADPSNPWRDAEAVAELAEIAAILRAIQAADAIDASDFLVP